MRRLLLASAIFLAACAEPTIKDGDIETLFTHEREIEVTSKVAINEMLKTNTLEGFIGKYAILQMRDQSSDYHLYIVDIESGEVVNKIFSRGRGRNEMIYTKFVGVNSGRMYIYDYIKNNLSSISTDDILTRNVDLKPEVIRGIDEGYSLGICNIISNNRVVTYKSERDDNAPSLAICSVEDNQLQEGEVFERLGEGLDDENKHFAYWGLLHSTTDNNAILYSTELGVNLIFYDCSDPQSPPQKVKEYALHAPKYNTLENNRVRPDDNTILGLQICGEDDDNFYTFYYGMTTYKEMLESYNENEGEYLPTILVFGKDGKPKEKLMFPDRVSSHIPYCNYNNSLYRLDYDDEGNDCLVQYKL